MRIVRKGLCWEYREKMKIIKITTNGKLCDNLKCLDTERYAILEENVRTCRPIHLLLFFRWSPNTYSVFYKSKYGVVKTWFHVHATDYETSESTINWQASVIEEFSDIKFTGANMEFSMGPAKDTGILQIEIVSSRRGTRPSWPVEFLQCVF